VWSGRSTAQLHHSLRHGLADNFMLLDIIIALQFSPAIATWCCRGCMQSAASAFAICNLHQQQEGNRQLSGAVVLH